MSRDTIVYFGIIQYEYNNAMCQHAAGIENMIHDLGYRAVTIGVSSNVRHGAYRKIKEDRYVINYPQNIKEYIKESASPKGLLAVINEIGHNRIKALVMADYRFIPMILMARYCKKYGIMFAADIMDRFISGSSLVSKIKRLDSELRMRILYPKVDRKIYICHAYEKLLGKGKHVAVIPGVGISLCREQIETQTERKLIRLVFLGRPGELCEKEKIDWIIKIIYLEKLTNKVELILAGFDKNKFLDKNEHLHKFLSDNIIFRGRIEHNECIKLIRSSDFSLVIRPDTVLSQYGFSTKIGEAFSCGIPVLATDTSDNKIYIENGQNGFVCGARYEDVRKMLKMVSALSKEKIEQMKMNCRNNNPLLYRNFVEQFKRVVIDK